MAVRVSVACFIICHIICYSIMDCSKNKNNKKKRGEQNTFIGHDQLCDCLHVWCWGCLKTPLVQLSASRGVHSSVYPWIRRRSNKHCVSCRVMVATSFSWSIYCCLHFGCGDPSNAAVKKGKL